MINEEAINRASERFGYFPNGFTSYRETLCAITVQVGYYDADPIPDDTEQELQIRSLLSAAHKERGHVGMFELCHEWASEFETKWKGHKWGEDEGLEWIEAIDEFFAEKCKSLEV